MTRVWTTPSGKTSRSCYHEQKTCWVLKRHGEPRPRTLERVQLMGLRACSWCSGGMV